MNKKIIKISLPIFVGLLSIPLIISCTKTTKSTTLNFIEDYQFNSSKKQFIFKIKNEFFDDKAININQIYKTKGPNTSRHYLNNIDLAYLYNFKTKITTTHYSSINKIDHVDTKIQSPDDMHRKIKIRIIQPNSNKTFFIDGKLYKNAVVFSWNDFEKNQNYILKNIVVNGVDSKDFNFKFSTNTLPSFVYDQSKVFTNNQYSDTFVDELLNYLQKTKAKAFDFNFIKQSKNKKFFPLLINWLLYENLTTPISLNASECQQDFWNAFSMLKNFQNFNAINLKNDEWKDFLKQEFDNQASVDVLTFPFYNANKNMNFNEFLKAYKKLIKNQMKIQKIVPGNEKIRTHFDYYFNFSKLSPYFYRQNYANNFLLLQKKLMQLNPKEQQAIFNALIAPDAKDDYSFNKYFAQIPTKYKDSVNQYLMKFNFDSLNQDKDIIKQIYLGNQYLLEEINNEDPWLLVDDIQYLMNLNDEQLKANKHYFKLVQMIWNGVDMLDYLKGYSRKKNDKTYRININNLKHELAIKNLNHVIIQDLITKNPQDDSLKSSLVSIQKQIDDLKQKIDSLLENFKKDLLDYDLNLDLIQWDSFKQRVIDNQLFTKESINKLARIFNK